jgi:hypothetical protein
LKRQKEAAARIRQHRSGHLGHAPSSHHRGSVSGGITSSSNNLSNKVGSKPIASPQEVKKPETWLKANTNSAYGEKPAHIAVGGPMSGLSIMQ